MKRREKLEGAYLEAFDRALSWAGFGPRMNHEPITSSSEALPVDSVRGEVAHEQAIIRNQGR